MLLWCFVSIFLYTHTKSELLYCFVVDTWSFVQIEFEFLIRFRLHPLDMLAKLCIECQNINKLVLNCPCHLHGSIHYRMPNWVPFYLVLSKVYVDMDNLFLFQFCLRDLFVKNEDAPCYARPIHGKGALALGQFQLARSFHIHNWEGRKWLSASRNMKLPSKFWITKL